VQYEQVGSLQAKEEALEGFRARGPEHKNCAQAVVHFSMRTLGRDPELTTAARFMGGGMARMGHTCGAVTGAVLSLGLRDLTDPDGVDADAVQVTEWLQELIRDFEREFAAVSCLELTGHDLSTREGYKAYAKSDAQPRCILFIEWVIDRLSDIL
jgi:C_GCAxxG_C_C family probable redox protein